MIVPSTKVPPAFMLRGRMLSLTVLKLFTLNLGEIEDRLLLFKEQAPELFNRLPLILDVEEVFAELKDRDVSDLCRLFKSYGFLPIAIQGGEVQLLKKLASEDLHILPHSTSQEALALSPLPPPTAEINPLPDKSTADLESTAPLLIEKHVRSGQQIYAQKRDLIVLASVNPGAEVLADGHVHIYGSLQGRALAGVQGNVLARIFCQDLNAELISIAGNYRLYESLPHAELRQRLVQVYLEEERLRIDFLKK